MAFEIREPKKILARILSKTLKYWAERKIYSSVTSWRGWVKISQAGSPRTSTQFLLKSSDLSLAFKVKFEANFKNPRDINSEQFLCRFSHVFLQQSLHSNALGNKPHNGKYNCSCCVVKNRLPTFTILKCETVFISRRNHTTALSQIIFCRFWAWTVNTRTKTTNDWRS